MSDEFDKHWQDQFRQTLEQTNCPRRIMVLRALDTFNVVEITDDPDLVTADADTNAAADTDAGASTNPTADADADADADDKLQKPPNPIG